MKYNANQYLALFDEIKCLSNKANEWIIENNIEQCNLILVERQKLLETLCEQSSDLCQRDPKFKNQLIELLLWVQEQDSPNVILLTTKKESLIGKSIKQLHAQKAIKQYKTI